MDHDLVFPRYFNNNNKKIFMESNISTSTNIRFLTENTNLSNEENNLIEHPPEIVKKPLAYLVSFPEKKRKNAPRTQNAWSIYLKNYGEHLRKTCPDEKFSLKDISPRAA